MKGVIKEDFLSIYPAGPSYGGEQRGDLKAIVCFSRIIEQSTPHILHNKWQLLTF